MCRPPERAERLLRLAGEAVRSPAPGARPLRRPAHRRSPKESVRAIHFGVDVSAPDGTAVYATPPTAWPGSRRRVVTPDRATDGSIFAYWHIQPAVQGGQRVAYKTVIGHISRAGATCISPSTAAACTSTRSVRARCGRTRTHLPWWRRFISSAAGRRRHAVRGRLDIVVSADRHARDERPGALVRATRDPGARPVANRRRQGNSVALPWRGGHDVRAGLPTGAFESSNRRHPARTARPARQVPVHPGRGLDAGPFRRVCTDAGRRARHAGNSGRSSWPLVDQG